MKISIGCDHAGYDYKEIIKSKLSEQEGVELIDCGTFGPDSVDYPDFAHKVASNVSDQSSEFGILICGSANGVAMTANKHPNIRCAICWSKEITQLARWHNDANIIALPARFMSSHQALTYAELFIKTNFEGGRHARRVSKIACT